MNPKKVRRTMVRAAGCSLLLGVGTLAACSGEGGSVTEKTSSIKSALGDPGGAQACVIGTRSLRLAQGVTTLGGLSTDALSMESGAIANGEATINNATAAQVRIAGATIRGNVHIAGAAPSIANGELLNGGTITGTVTAGSAQQAVLPTHAVPVGTVSVTVNPGDPPKTQIQPGSYAAVTLNGSRASFPSGTYNLASLVVNAGAQIVFQAFDGPVNINVQGPITINGNAAAFGPGPVTLYSNSASSQAVRINAGVGEFPATITAPNGGISIGSRNTVVGCVGGKDVAFEPDSHISECLTVPVDGSSVSSALTYSASSTFKVVASGSMVWGGCDPVNCPNAASCTFARLGDAQFHSDNCFTGPDPTFTVFNFPIQLFMNGAPLPATPFSPDHVYTVTVPGNDGHFTFNYNDIPGTFGDNSGTLKACISAP